MLSGACSSRYTLHLKSGKAIKYSGDYALCDGIPYGCKRYTKLIVDDLIKQVYESDWFLLRILIRLERIQCLKGI